MSVWLPTAPCSRACVGDPSGTVRVPRAALRLAALLAVLLVGVVALPLGRWLPARWVRLFARAVVRTTGVRTRLTGGTPPGGGLLIVANHISWMDIPLLAAVRPARMVAKREIRGWPVAGFLTARAGVIFIDRDRLRALPGTVARLAGVLRSGGAVTVFPEGSTWCGRAGGTFRRAAFQAALDAGVPVQPVRIGYRLPDGAVSTAPAFVGDDTLLAALWRVVCARRIEAHVTVLPVLAAGAHRERGALARAAEEAVGGRVRAAEPRGRAHVPSARLK
ncbi:lysophospholipid acyltransferase family protein [Streptomyces sp. NPDC006422]|uniref:lysophospholipid acyltransferase family protein n=1 Tax=unclassified Streptomyces TaxID=2593676 RepID=UPI0033B72C21